MLLELLGTFQGATYSYSNTVVWSEVIPTVLQFSKFTNALHVQIETLLQGTDEYTVVLLSKFLGARDRNGSVKSTQH